MIIFLRGDDTFRLREKVNQYKKKFFQEDPQAGFNFFSFSADNFNLGRFLSVWQSGGFLSKRRMIIAENVLKRKENQKNILSFLSKGNNDNTLIFIEIEEKSNKKKTVYSKEILSFLNKQEHFEFYSLSEKELRVWLQKRSRQKKIKLDKEAESMLISFIGSDLWKMENELEKLSCFSKNKTIEKETVEQVVSFAVKENVFDLIEALVLGYKKKYLRLLDDFFQQNNTEPLFFLSLLIRQFRLLLLAKSFLESNPYGDLAGVLKVPLFLEIKIKQQTQKYDLNRLKRFYSFLLFLDKEIKKGDYSPSFLFTLLIKL